MSQALLFDAHGTPGGTFEGYRTIMTDPPWAERGGGKVKRGADRHYPLLPSDEIAGVIKSSGVFVPHEDCHLWMWATNNYLGDALAIIAELGFEYKTNAVWVKSREPQAESPRLQIGLGQYLRGSHELLLFATRGQGQAPDTWTGRRNIPSAFLAPRGRHSAKPVESYELIESVSKGPRVEIFARGLRDGWESWGNDPSVVNESKG